MKTFLTTASVAMPSEQQEMAPAKTAAYAGQLSARRACNRLPNGRSQKTARKAA
jgi:hypothetical protein